MLISLDFSLTTFRHNYEFKFSEIFTATLSGFWNCCKTWYDKNTDVLVFLLYHVFIFAALCISNSNNNNNNNNNIGSLQNKHYAAAWSDWKLPITVTLLSFCLNCKLLMFCNEILTCISMKNLKGAFNSFTNTAWFWFYFCLCFSVSISVSICSHSYFDQPYQSVSWLWSGPSCS